MDSGSRPRWPVRSFMRPRDVTVSPSTGREGQVERPRKQLNRARGGRRTWSRRLGMKSLLLPHSRKARPSKSRCTGTIMIITGPSGTRTSSPAPHWRSCIYVTRGCFATVTVHDSGCGMCGATHPPFLTRSRSRSHRKWPNRLRMVVTPTSQHLCRAVVRTSIEPPSIDLTD